DPARGIDVNRDVLLGVLRFQEEHLRHHDVGHVVVDRADDEDQALLEEARIDVIRPLAAGGLLDDDGYQIQCTLVHDASFSPDCGSAPLSGFWTKPVMSWKVMATSFTFARSRSQSIT